MLFYFQVPYFSLCFFHYDESPLYLAFLHCLLSFSLLSCCEIFLCSSAFNAFGWLVYNNCKTPKVVLSVSIISINEVENSSTLEGLLSVWCCIK